jgi:hypothetical protein
VALAGPDRSTERDSLADWPAGRQRWACERRPARREIAARVRRWALSSMRKGGLEPPRLAALVPKTRASTNSATFAHRECYPVPGLSRSQPRTGEPPEPVSEQAPEPIGDAGDKEADPEPPFDPRTQVDRPGGGPGFIVGHRRAQTNRPGLTWASCGMEKVSPKPATGGADTSAGRRKQSIPRSGDAFDAGRGTVSVCPRAMRRPLGQHALPACASCRAIAPPYIGKPRAGG